MSVKSHVATAAVLHLQLHQHPYKSVQNVKLLMCTKFGNDKCITSQIIECAAFFSFTLKKVLPLQLWYCSCSSSSAAATAVAF